MYLHDFPVNAVFINWKFNSDTSFDQEKLVRYFQILIISILNIKINNLAENVG